MSFDKLCRRAKKAFGITKHTQILFDHCIINICMEHIKPYLFPFHSPKLHINFWKYRTQNTYDVLVISKIVKKNIVSDSYEVFFPTLF